jgi:hypothetical protein
MHEMRRAARILMAGLIALCAGGGRLALAKPANAPARVDPARAAAPPAGVKRIAVAPLVSLTEEERKVVAAVEELVANGLASVDKHEVVGVAEVRKAIKRAKRVELESCEGDAHCLAELGRLVGASAVVAGDVSALAEGNVVYLKVVDVGTQREAGSTTAVLGGTETAMAAESRAAAHRLLAPRSYMGRLALKIDVAKATVYVDGRKVEWSADRPMPLSVGTHALRVTHEQYRDFVRFVDVKFDQVAALTVPLTAFPVVTDEMRQKEAKRRKAAYAGPYEPLPWYRKWYTVAGAGAVALVATALVVALTSDAIDRDKEVTVGP